MSAPEPARAAATALALLSILLVAGCSHAGGPRPLSMGKDADGQDVYYVEIGSLMGSEYDTYKYVARLYVEPICAKEGKFAEWESSKVLDEGNWLSMYAPKKVGVTMACVKRDSTTSTSENMNLDKPHEDTINCTVNGVRQWVPLSKCD